MAGTASLKALRVTLIRFTAVCGLAVGAAVLASPAIAQTRVDLVERGRYLVETIAACGHCHSPQRLDGDRQVELPGLHLAGGYGFDGPVLGRWAGSNITRDVDTGIGRWTEGEIAIAVREGRRPDGSVIGPPMPFAHYRKISDVDARSIAAYLKSVPPIRNAVTRSSYRISLPANWGPPVSDITAPPEGDPVARGAYLVEVGHCMDCHTPNRAAGGGRDWSRRGAGGRPVTGLAGPIPAANITPHPEHGLGRWTDGQIIRAITQGISANGRRLLPPMAFDNYAGMTSRDLADLVAYLRSLPPQP
jgi:mono/diheme cytochrome c family protein